MRIELRTCIKCGETKDIPQPKAHANNICIDCSRKQCREYQRNEAIREGRRQGINGRYPYPLEGKWAYPSQKFNTMAKKMKYMMDREEWVAQIRINYEETINNPLVMEWIKAHKDDTPKPKKQKTINKNYPDTRGMTWEEYMKGLGEEDVDS
uniref:Uncharacterized protein n=1 Tax=uncultured Caudovirales phage TaxID=2100421 RepID=A0A6J7WYU8_9CAUD|nr:hypothetical protein UFOVP385_20 [uncultured Caudovirales phage]